MTNLYDVGTLRLSINESLLAVGTSLSFYILIYNLNSKGTVMYNDSIATQSTMTLTWLPNNLKLFVIDTEFTSHVYLVDPSGQTIHRINTIDMNHSYTCKGFFYLQKSNQFFTIS
jgi:hypothetical protein